jgi:hypothetical protein
MLLVMNTTGLFDEDQPLTAITKDRIHSFLPGLWEEVFKMSIPSGVSNAKLAVSSSCLFIDERGTTCRRFVSCRLQQNRRVPTISCRRRVNTH